MGLCVGLDYFWVIVLFVEFVWVVVLFVLCGWIGGGM